ncbi:MAG: DUF2203 domain-containing protein [Acidimicrobiales bacterium]
MRIFSEDEARALVPRVRRLLELLRRSAGLAAASPTNGHATAGAAHDEGRLALDPAAAAAEIEELGIVVRDVERGLVDFPCRHRSGRVVQLCWQLGEEDLAWWHLPEDGFAGRRPLPLPPEL